MFSKLKNVAHLGGNEPPSSRQEQSLVTVLPTTEQRTDLLLLVAHSTEAMRQRIFDTFDADKTGEASLLKLSVEPSTTPNPESTQSSGKVVASRASGEADENAQAISSNSGATDDNKEASSDAEKEAKQRERRVKDLANPAMKDLKKAALNHFDTWRDKVISRVGEAVNRQAEEENSSPMEQEIKSDAPTQSTQDVPPPATEDTEADVALHRLYAPQKTSLSSLDKPQRVLVLHSILLLLLGLESYPAESRILMLHITSSLSLPVEVLSEDESRVAQGLLEAARQQMNADKETKEKANASAMSRSLKVGLGAAAGAVLIGVTGGLAAPLLAAGVGSVMGGLGLGATVTAGYLGALAGSAPLVGVLFGAYGGKMTGEMVDEYAKEVKDFAFIPVQKQHHLSFGKHKEDEKTSRRHLRVAIGISGYLTEESQIVSPWQIISNANAEAFALRWELKCLLNLGHALTTYVKSYAWGYAKKEIISHTIFAALSAALTLPYGLAKASRVVDNPFSVARSRSEKAGRVLADALINKVQGERPVTLMGYSLGARVIFHCLKELAERGAFGLIESVILIGAATPSDSLEWRGIRTVVSGRVVNVFSSKDYLLGFLYRASSLQFGVAGLQPIRDVEGVENVDVSDLVDGHTKYRLLIGKVVQRVGWEDVDVKAVERQMASLQKEEKREAEEEAESESKIDSKDADDAKAEAEAEKMENEIQEKSKASQAIDWMGSRMSGLHMSDSGAGGKVDKGNLTEEEKLRRAEQQ
ncbi:uncharacterized protein BCR38DRAFT_428274 [Pseudomassariella vexata]|uniref:DUF726-domain-containing protein n=1 Tax=Pseudomassariella vexata TaxID=1141098 RepID=A0A1Y2E4G4_9PEZI|nr:uncharacterized protein BCR38DRAFT_428274 [Pseudomassariella vexata]ORY65755.1 hypothetical protein BCR38DRAFT_428274 [Pseudomassariella vexata]